MKEDVNMRKIKKSFYTWCVDNNKEHYIELWDYELNNCSPKDVSCVVKDYYYFKCPCGQHESFKKGISNLVYSKDLICPQCNSFYQWCINNKKEIFIDCWDYSKNKEDIHYISKATNKKCWFTIEGHSYLYPLTYITSKTNSNPVHKYYNSFGYYLISLHGKEAIENLWSNKNTISPFEIDVCSKKKVWIKCSKKEYHGDYQIKCHEYKQGNRCPMCASKIVHTQDSFAEFQKRRFGKDWVEKCWCDDNILDPYKIPVYKNHVKVHIKCYNVEYHDFWITPSNYSTNIYGCPYCGNGSVHHKTHPNDSLGVKHPEIFDIWSDKNQLTPYDYADKTHKKVWLKCKCGKHEDYLRVISDYTSSQITECPKCVKERRQSFLQEKVSNYIVNELGYNVSHEHNCNCIPINIKTKMPMPFDNEIKELKLIIETHGLQHYELTGWHTTRAKKSGKTPEEEFEYQKWKDEYKKRYAIEQGYSYLEIPYWSEQDDMYKQLILNKIKDIV